MTPELQTLVAKALTAWPKLFYKGGRNSRAHAAAALVEHGKVRRVVGDCYDVDGHACHAEADVCDCEDHEQGGAPFYPKVGRLCKHRLAARMYRVWGGERNQRLLELLQTVTGQPWARLIVEWDYRTDQRAVVGVESPLGRQRWPGGDGVAFDWLQLRWALAQIEWGLARLPEKGKRWEYIYRLQPGRGINITEQTMHVQGVTDAMVQRHDMEVLWVESLARHGNQIGVTVSETTMRAVAQRRAELQPA